MVKNNMYLFIPYSEYMAEHEVTDEEGAVSMVHTSPYWSSHSHARANYEQTEVVLSCSAHSEECSCVNHAAAVARIATWVKSPEDEQVV
jgi:hypothetical protein